jgi:hypothetical protein
MRPYLKNNLKANKAQGVAPVVEGLPTKHKALSSNPNTAKNKQMGIESFWGCNEELYD